MTDIELISKKTRSEFQEYLVSKTLREIERYFDNYDVKFIPHPIELLPSGQRRSHVLQYYASINWGNYHDVKKILNVYSDILTDLSSSNDTWNKEKIDRLTKYLLKDGYQFIDGKLVSIKPVANFEEFENATNLLDKEHFKEYIDRIKKSVDEDPGLAIGSTKELIEATLKTILNELKLGFDKDDDIPKLLKQVQKALDLVPDTVDDSKKGSDIIKILLSNLGQVVVKVAELRNLYGTGHGKENKRKGLNERHARLTVGAGITLATFLLETFELKHNEAEHKRLKKQ
ncbi:MAG TPA: abortive infection family protein [Bacteroidia bacterium]|nr:abortive infection family protein [Bacteroidia bacterium]